jgi:hypothetical protein
MAIIKWLKVKQIFTIKSLTSKMSDKTHMHSMHFHKKSQAYFGGLVWKFANFAKDTPSPMKYVA